MNEEALNRSDTQRLIGHYLPKGIITMWYGNIASIPKGWALCNGDNDTPDLRDKFIVGATSDDSGTAKTNVTGSLTQSGAPTHQHELPFGNVSSAVAQFTVDWGTGSTQARRRKVDSAEDTTESAYAKSNVSAAIPTYYALAYVMKL